MVQLDTLQWQTAKLVLSRISTDANEKVYQGMFLHSIQTACSLAVLLLLFSDLKKLDGQYEGQVSVV